MLTKLQSLQHALPGRCCPGPVLSLLSRQSSECCTNPATTQPHVASTMHCGILFVQIEIKIFKLCILHKRISKTKLIMIWIVLFTFLSSCSPWCSPDTALAGAAFWPNFPNTIDHYNLQHVPAAGHCWSSTFTQLMEMCHCTLP